MTEEKIISIIAAIANNNVIGKGNKLPWRIPADLKHFRNLTLGRCVVMGRKTFESIGKPLEGRNNIIITRDKNYKADGCHVAHSTDEAVAISAGEVFFIGGAEIYKEIMPFAKRLYVTRIYYDFDGDAHFPEVNFSSWEEIERKKGEKNKRNPYDYEFLVYKKK